jgi:hypothetical protein
VRLYILDNLPCNIVLGLDAWEMLPLTLTLNGTIIFKGFSQVATQRAEPKLEKGEGVNFVNRNGNKQKQVPAILMKQSNSFFE